MSGTGHLDLDAADRARLLASATAYAAGRRTYVVGAVSDVIAANAGRLDAAAREALADAIRPAADAGDSIDAPAWTRALATLETAAPDGSDGLDGSPVDLRILLFCAFRHDMGDDAGLWTRLLDDPPEEIDGQWRAISARDLYEAFVHSGDYDPDAHWVRRKEYGDGFESVTEESLLADAWHMRDDIVELARRGDVRKSLPDIDFDARLARLEAEA